MDKEQVLRLFNDFLKTYKVIPAEEMKAREEEKKRKWEEKQERREARRKRLRK
jgi:hypothetical protein